MNDNPALSHEVDDGYEPYAEHLSALANLAGQKGDYVLAARVQAALDELQMVLIIG